MINARNGEMAIPNDAESRRSEDIAIDGDRLPVPEPEPMEPSELLVDDERAVARRRRRFSADYKLKILREADACRGPGEIGALLRRERIYSSHLALWRRQREEAAQMQLRARKRGPKPRLEDPRLRQLQRENTRLQGRLDRLERMRRQAARILGVHPQSLEGDEDD